MKHNPVQVVLNPQRYIGPREINPNGSYEDFYGGKDDEFKVHRASLLRQVEYAKRVVENGSVGGAVLKVELNPSALAKSHRPVDRLFPHNKSPHIGGTKIGTMLFQVSSKSIEWLEYKIDLAEDFSNLVDDKSTGKKKYKPSAERSEVGAIDKISIYESLDRLGFPLESAEEWLAEGNTIGKGYFVELFEYSDNVRPEYSISSSKVSHCRYELYQSLLRLGAGVVASKASEAVENSNIIYIRLYKPWACEAHIDFNNVKRMKHLDFDLFDEDFSRHELLLQILLKNPLIKKVSLPPKLSRSESSHILSSEKVEVIEKADSESYPKVGLIDSGIRSRNLQTWVIGDSIGFNERDCDPNHASQVASLLVKAKRMNSHLEGIEEDGCEIYDIWAPIHLERNSFHQYFDGYGEFFDWLDAEVGAARRKGVRIFNFSVNLRELVKDDSYSFAASQIDRISKKHDVIFVVSAGNLDPIDYRSKWPTQSSIISDIDRIQQPAEAISAVTVGAINPPGTPEIEPGSPTIYSRRGPGVGTGVKPDVVHYGGFISDNSGTGLFSENSTEQIMHDAGTSFAAPLVAKTLAAIEHRLNRTVSRNTLLAMLIHHSNLPEAVNVKSVTKEVMRRFVGFGKPSPSEEMLLTDDHAITIVFEGELKIRQDAEFYFDWPSSLVNDEGKCRGKATLTLAYDPIVNTKFGSEYCRVNVNATLQQNTYLKPNDEWKYRKKGDSVWVSRTPVSKESSEKHRIEHGLKWWPIKKFVQFSKSGVGKSRNWRLKVDSLEREAGSFPSEGIKFCAMLTIEDDQKTSHRIFNEVNQSLISSGVQVMPIEVDQRLKVKGD